MTKPLEDVLKEIVERLLPLAPDRIILFGSHAWGQPDADSDLDLLVVTGDEFLPASYDDRLEIQLRVDRELTPIHARTSLDLIVHTRPMFDRFQRTESSLAREIRSRGRTLYERAVG
jgi:uncharacterized protein